MAKITRYLAYLANIIYFRPISFLDTLKKYFLIGPPPLTHRRPKLADKERMRKTVQSVRVRKAFKGTHAQGSIKGRMHKKV